MVDKYIIDSINYRLGTKYSLKNESSIKLKWNAEKTIKRLIKYIPNDKWDAIILNKRKNRSRINHRTYNPKNVYILREGYDLCKEKIALLYLPIAPYGSRSYKNPSFLYFLIPVVIALIIAVMIDSFLSIKENEI